jgi:hypothetical protein
MDIPIPELTLYRYINTSPRKNATGLVLTPGRVIGVREWIETPAATAPQIPQPAFNFTQKR